MKRQFINPEKTKVLWYSLNNRNIKDKMPDITIENVPNERRHNLKYLGIHLNRTFVFSKHVENKNDT